MHEPDDPIEDALKEFRRVTRETAVLDEDLVPTDEFAGPAQQPLRRAEIKKRLLRRAGNG